MMASCSWNTARASRSASTTAASAAPGSTPSLGFGLRAVAGEATGYAHAGELSEAGPAARREQRGGGGGRAIPASRRSRRGPPMRGSTPMPTRSAPTDFPARTALLAEIDAYARGKDPRVVQVMASIAGEWQAVQIMRADGTRVADLRPLVRLNVAVVVEQDGRRETGSYGTGGRFAYDHVTAPRQSGAARSTRRCARRWSTSTASRPRPARWRWCSARAGPGILLHEAIGHGLEGDFNRKKTSAFAGLLGQRIAAPGVTVVDDGTLPDRRGSLTVDDEGTPTSRTVLIEDGVLVGFMQDRLNARLMGMRADRQRPPAVLRPRADAAHDQHRDAGRGACAGGDDPLGEARPLRGEFRRRPGGHHLGQVRVLGAARPT